MSHNNALHDCLKDFKSIRIAAGVVVFQSDEACTNFYFVQHGSIRVELSNHNGNSVVLYRIGANETCVLTTSCLLSGDRYSAEAVTETEVSVIVVPRADFEHRLNSSPEFRELVFTSFSSRLAAMMAKIDEIAFTPLDARLAGRLAELSQADPVIKVTHEQLANDLGSAREVISRKLLSLENDGLLKRGRGTIEIIARQVLVRRAHVAFGDAV